MDYRRGQICNSRSVHAWDHCIQMIDIAQCLLTIRLCTIAAGTCMDWRGIPYNMYVQYAFGAQLQCMMEFLHVQVWEAKGSEGPRERGGGAANLPHQAGNCWLI